MQRRSSRLRRGAILLAALLAAAAALAANTGCGEDEESCNCYCTDPGKTCATTTDGRTGCGMTLELLPCSPSGCCKFCCDG